MEDGKGGRSGEGREISREEMNYSTYTASHAYTKLLETPNSVYVVNMTEQFSGRYCTLT